MGEKMLRFVVNEVNKMLKTDYNMISSDSLSTNALLQVFADSLNNLSKVGVLMRILDILQRQNFSLALQNRQNEEKHKDDTAIPDYMPELIKACKEIAMKINNQKADITLVRQDLQNLKTENEELNKSHQQAKEVYDLSISTFHTEITKLEGEIHEMERTVATEEERWKNIRKKIERKEDILAKLSNGLLTYCKEKHKDDTAIPDNMPELIKACKEIAMKINNQKADTTLVRQDLQNLKTENEELNKSHQQAKEVYDLSISNFNTEITKLEGELHEMEITVATEEKRWKNIRKKIERKEDILAKLSNDLLTYGKKKSQIEILNEQIIEQESFKKEIEIEMQKTMSEKEEREQQVILWHSNLEILKCKKQCSDNKYD